MRSSFHVHKWTFVETTDEHEVTQFYCWGCDTRRNLTADEKWFYFKVAGPQRPIKESSPP